MMYKQGDILLIPIPFSNLSSSKRRPVLVLSNNSYNKLSEDIVVAAITSNIRGLDFETLINNEHLIIGRLPKTSCVRSDKIYTLSKNIVIKNYGQVSRELIQDVVQKVNCLIR